MTSLLLAFALAAPSPAPAGDADADAAARQSRSEYSFDDDEVEGELPSTDHVAIQGHRGARFSSLVKGRANFIDKLHAQSLDI